MIMRYRKHLKTAFRLSLLLFFYLPATLQAKALSNIKMAHTVLSSNLLQSLLAKEFCSCIYVVRPGGEDLTDENRKELCYSNTSLPIDRSTIESLVTLSVDSIHQRITVEPTLKGRMISANAKSAHAQLVTDEYGCRLLIVP